MDFTLSYAKRRTDPSFSWFRYIGLYVADWLLACTFHGWLWYMCGASAVLLKLQQVNKYVTPAHHVTLL